MQLYGLDAEAGFKPFEHFTVYASGELMRSDVKSNEIVANVGAAAIALPTKGKELVLTPDRRSRRAPATTSGGSTSALQREVLRAAVGSTI